MKKIIGFRLDSKTDELFKRACQLRGTSGQAVFETFVQMYIAETEQMLKEGEIKLL